MRLHYYFQPTFSSLILLLPSFAISISINCEHIREDKVSWNFDPLDNPYSLYRVNEHDSKITNTTFTFNICRALIKGKGAPANEDCPSNTRGKGLDRSST